ncbi:MAG: aminotransferase class I/II-fold pyridoxal phosphate-dependent enzyme [Bacteroidota bacterium]
MTTTSLIAPSSRLGQTKEYYFSRKLREIAELRAAGQDIINLGIGSPDLPPAPSVIQTLTDAAQAAENHGYQSYTGIPALKESFAAWYERCFYVSLNPNNEVLPLIGSKEGIMHISMAFLDAGDEVLVPNPGYPTYRSATELAGGTVRTYDLSAESGWLPDLDKLAADGLGKVKIMWINYPHMPTGTQAPAGFYERLVDFALRHQILIVNDNPYAFILTDERKSILSIPGAKETALELTSLSKAQNMAGWRVGALLGHPEYLQTVLRFKSNMDSGTFKPIQLAATQALALGEEWYENLNSIYRKRREKVYQIFDGLGCSYDKNQVGLFVWAKCPAGKTGYDISDFALYEKGVFLTPGGIFGSQGEAYARISLCSDLPTLQSALERIQS